MYTIHEAAELCGSDPRTVRNYVQSELMEVNKLMPYPKFIVLRKSCGLHDGFMVDPTVSSDERLLSSCDRSIL